MSYEVRADEAAPDNCQSLFDYRFYGGCSLAALTLTAFLQLFTKGSLGWVFITSSVVIFIRAVCDFRAARSALGMLGHGPEPTALLQLGVFAGAALASALGGAWMLDRILPILLRAGGL